jgi:hypothetical protein
MNDRGGQTKLATDLFNRGIPLEAISHHFEFELGAVLLFLYHL